jgi:threonine dehydrogenase-like Zn-dependent dehydrogenase
VLAGPGRVELVRREAVEPGPDQVVVAVEGCGVCGSNLPVWQGRPWFDYPLAPGVPGHEGWGHVEAVGDAIGGATVGGPAVGTRVAFLADDAFGEKVVVPARHLVALPARLDGVAFPGEALGCGFNAAARSGFAPGQTVAVVGVGLIGAVIVWAAAAAGARVIAISRRPFALDVARAMGAAETIPLGERGAVVGAVAELTDGRMCDVAVEAVGLQEPLDLAGELTRVRGRLVVAGFHQDGSRTVDLQLWNWRGIDVVNAHERDPEAYLTGIRAAVAATESGGFDPAVLSTHRFPLDRLGPALDAMVERPDGFLKAWVEP